jgi:hypothetical protein
VFFLSIVYFSEQNIPLLSDANNIYSEGMQTAKEFTDSDYLTQRFTSIIIRSSTISYAVQIGLESIFGFGESLHVVTGLILYSLVTAGVIGLISIILLYKYIIDIFYCLYKYARDSQLEATLFTGLMIQAFVFNDYGYTTVHGVPLIALMIKRATGKLVSIRGL